MIDDGVTIGELRQAAECTCKLCQMIGVFSWQPDLKAQMIEATIDLLAAICSEWDENAEGHIAELIDLVAIVGEIDMKQSPNRQILAEIAEYEDEAELMAA